MSRHSSANAQDLVKSNQELRSKVLELQDKLSRSDAAIKTAIAAATDGYHHGGSNLSVTTHPSSILSLAESIASNATYTPSPGSKGSRGGGKVGDTDGRTPPLHGTNADRIDRLVISNRELRHEVSDKDAKIGKAMQEAAVHKQQAAALEGKVAALYEDLEKADKALLDAQDDLRAMEALPAQWELDKVRLVAAQDKERDHMIELLNRERSDKEDMRVGYEEALQRALTAQAAEAAALRENARQMHVQELRAEQEARENARQAHVQELRAEQEAWVLERQQVQEARELERQQAQLQIDKLNEEVSLVGAELTDAHGVISAQQAVSMHQLKMGQGSKAAEDLMSLPMAVQRQPSLPSRTSYVYFPLELNGADYAARLLHLLDESVRPIVANRLLMRARQSNLFLKMQLPPSPEKEAWEVRAEEEEEEQHNQPKKREGYHESSPQRNLAPDISTESDVSEQLFVPIQALLAAPSAVAHTSQSVQERHTFSLDAFLALSPTPKKAGDPSRSPREAASMTTTSAKQAQEADGVAATAFAAATARLPVSPLDLITLYLQQCPHAEVASCVGTLRLLESRSANRNGNAYAPDTTCFDAVRKVVAYFQGLDKLAAAAETKAPAPSRVHNSSNISSAALRALQMLEGQVNTHSRFKATRLAVMGWKGKDVPTAAEPPPAVVHTMEVLMDTIRFTGVASDANQLSRLCQPLVRLLELLKPQAVKDNLRYWCRLRQWKVKLAGLGGVVAEGAGVEEIIAALESMLNTPICSTNSADSAISALLEFVQSDELLALSTPYGGASAGKDAPVVSGIALMRYICLVSCVALDALDVLAAVHRRAEEEREHQAAAQLQALRTKLQELVNATLEVDTRAVFAFPERAVNAHLLRSAEHMLRRASLGAEDGVGCYFLRADGIGGSPPQPRSESKGHYCLRMDASSGVLPTGRWTHLLSPLVPDALVARSEGGRYRLSAGFIWEAPYACEGQEGGGFDACDRLSCASLALRTHSPELMLLAYRTLPGLKLRVPLSTFQLMLTQRQHRLSAEPSAHNPASDTEEPQISSQSQDKRLPCVDPLDPHNEIVPATWVAQFVAQEEALPGPVALRRAYGVSIFTLMDCRMFARVDVLRACAFSVVDLTQQHTYHEARISSASSIPVPQRATPVGNALEYIHGELGDARTPKKAGETPDKLLRRASVATNRRASLSPGAAVSPKTPGSGRRNQAVSFFLSEDGHHFAPFLVHELRTAGVNARDARQVLAANPQQLQLGGYDDASIVTQSGFSLSELTSCGAVRINQYAHIQRLVLAEFYLCTSSGVPVSAIRLDRKDADNVKHDGWRRDFNWCSSRPIGDWYGVTTDSRRNVVKIDLRGNRLRGALPPCTRLLQTLETFDVHDNELTGPLALWLAELPALRVLNIHTNFLDQTAESQQTLSVLSKALPDCLIRA